MPQIDFNFSGWVREARIEAVTITATGKKLNVSKMNAKKLAKGLNNGTYSISLGDFLYDNNRKSEIEITDFDVPL